MHAIVENVITCAEPKECCQPGTELVDFGEGDSMITLEFCLRHAVKRYREQGIV